MIPLVTVLLRLTTYPVCLMYVREGPKESNISLNQESVKAASRASYRANPDKKMAASWAASCASYRANPDKKRAASRASYRANPDKKRAASRAATYTYKTRGKTTGFSLAMDATKAQTTSSKGTTESCRLTR